MLRRFILAGLAAALAGPLYAVSPASATVLLTCNTIEPYYNYTNLAPGLSHTPSAQTMTGFFIADNCSDSGEAADVEYGTDWSQNPITSYPPRPLACPTVAPDYPDQTPILLGATDPSMRIDWSSGTSFGIAKVKQGQPDTWKLVYSITSGQYAPPAGKKTKLKAEVSFTPNDSYDCFGDSDPASNFTLALAGGGSLVLNQK
jgi:hypothetical protein